MEEFEAKLIGPDAVGDVKAELNEAERERFRRIVRRLGQVSADDRFGGRPRGDYVRAVLPVIKEHPSDK